MDRPHSGLYLRQFLSGADFASSDAIATQMVNYAYAVGDYASGECLLIDPAYDPGALIGAVEADGFTAVGALATHYHPDHVGGDLFGHQIVGIVGLSEIIDIPIHAQRAELEWITKSTGIASSQLVGHDAGDTVTVGDISVELLHTPGHTPGSQCFLVEDCLIAGDTLFLDGCGRTDLPGSDPAAMLQSLRALAKIDDSVTLYPGHRYSPAPHAPMGQVKATNAVLTSLPPE